MGIPSMEKWRILLNYANNVTAESKGTALTLSIPLALPLPFSAFNSLLFFLMWQIPCMFSLFLQQDLH